MASNIISRKQQYEENTFTNPVLEGFAPEFAIDMESFHHQHQIFLDQVITFDPSSYSLCNLMDNVEWDTS
eukprot:11487738-Ditylum_brightwellii.AAC.1